MRRAPAILRSPSPPPRSATPSTAIGTELPPVRGSPPLPLPVAEALDDDWPEPVPDVPDDPEAEALDELCEGDCVALPDPPLLRFDPELLLPFGFARGSWYWLSPALWATAAAGSASASTATSTISDRRVIHAYS